MEAILHYVSATRKANGNLHSKESIAITGILSHTVFLASLFPYFTLISPQPTTRAYRMLGEERTDKSQVAVGGRKSFAYLEPGTFWSQDNTFSFYKQYRLLYILLLYFVSFFFFL
jgi:hypothetical protein